MKIPVYKVFDVALLLYRLEKLVAPRELLDQALANNIADHRNFVLSDLTHLAAEQTRSQDMPAINAMEVLVTTFATQSG